MRGITEEFVQGFRQRRKEKDWDLWQFREWVAGEEAKLREENYGLHDYINRVLLGLEEILDASLRARICEHLYFHFLELLAMVREHEQIEELEKLWGE